MAEIPLLIEYSLSNFRHYLTSILNLANPSVTAFTHKWFPPITIYTFVFLAFLALIVAKVPLRSILGVYLVSFLAAVSISTGSPLILAAITFKLFIWTGLLKAIGKILRWFGRDGTPHTKTLAGFVLVILSGIALGIVAVAFVEEAEDAKKKISHDYK